MTRGITTATEARVTSQGMASARPGNVSEEQFASGCRAFSTKSSEVRPLPAGSAGSPFFWSPC